MHPLSPPHALHRHELRVDQIAHIEELITQPALQHHILLLLAHQHHTLAFGVLDAKRPAGKLGRHERFGHGLFQVGEAQIADEYGAMAGAG
eukprot:ctg_3809.g645